MKRMKRMIGLFFAALMMVSVIGCGGKEQSTTLLFQQEGMTMEYKMDAKGDIVNKITQTTTIDCSMYSDEDIQAMQDAISQASSTYDGIDGVSYDVQQDGTNLVEVIIIDASNADTLKAMSASGMLPIDGDATKISMKKAVESMESQGFTVKE